MAGVLANLGTKTAFVVHGAGGLDEISTIGPTRISEVRSGKVNTYYLDPAEYGLPYTSMENLKGGSAQENAEITRQILNGAGGPGRDIVMLNSAVALLASGNVKSVGEGLEKAAVILPGENSMNSGNSAIHL